MENVIKSGKDVIEDFFAEILNVPNADEKTVQKLVELYGSGKFTERAITNAMDELTQAELKKVEKEDE
ncbi:MAG: hypothetical protein ACRD6X_14360 [Pyrinomonadaceae bacterium]